MPNLTLNEFQQLASRTLPPLGSQRWFPTAPNTPQREANNRQIDLIHAVFGCAGEAGELVDPVKKAMFYGKAVDVENIKEEAGDLLWYIAGPLCRALGCTLEELAAANVAKLRKRYPEKYTDEAAIARADKDEPAPQPYPPKPATVTAGTRLRSLTDEEQNEIRRKYAGQLVDFGDGYFWDEDARSWQICPECWEPVTTTA